VDLSLCLPAAAASSASAYR